MLKFSLFTVLLIVSTISFAQEKYIAVITEPQIGIQENANNLIQVVNDISRRKNISQVIVLGNITANGKFDEFIWAQEILDGLTIPYFVIGGERDYFLSQGRGSEITLLWGDDKKIFNGRNYNLLCLNTILPEYSTHYHFASETLNWVDDKLSKSNKKRIITFTYFPISKVDNSSKFFEMTLGYKFFSFVSKKEKQKSEIPTLEGLYLNRKNDWGYLLISNNKDSLNVIKILGSEVKKKSNPEIIVPVFAPIKTFESIKPVETFSSVDEIWSVSFDKTLISSPVSRGDKIFAGFKDGTIVCISSTGQEKWKYDSHGKIQNSPVTSEDVLITADTNGDISILNVNTGPPAQVIGIGEKLSGISVVDLANNSKGIVAGTANGNLYCYDLANFEQVWTNQISDYAINAPIIYSRNNIYFKDIEGTLYCVSVNNGLLIWKISSTQGGWKIQSALNKIKANDNLFVTGNNLFLVDDIGNLFCIDALLGLVEWNIKNIDASGIIRLNSNNDLIIPTDKSKILIISIKSKKIINEIALPQDGNALTDLRVINNIILTGFDDGWVYRIKPKQMPEKIFRGGTAPIVSLTNINGDCLVTDYDGNFTLLKIASDKK